MKIAIASDDGRNISDHFGKAEFYVVIEMEAGEIMERRLVSKVSVQCQCNAPGSQKIEGSQPSENERYTGIFEPIKECDVLIASGMGASAFQQLIKMGLRAVFTELDGIDDVLKAFATKQLTHNSTHLY